MALHPYDLYDVRSLLSEEERAVQDTVARFTDERVLPIIGKAFDEGRSARRCRNNTAVPASTRSATA